MSRRVCRRCGMARGEAEFVPGRSWCRSCYNGYQRTWRQQNAEALRQRAVLRRMWAKGFGGSIPPPLRPDDCPACGERRRLTALMVDGHRRAWVCGGCVRICARFGYDSGRLAKEWATWRADIAGGCTDIRHRRREERLRRLLILVRGGMVSGLPEVPPPRRGESGPPSHHGGEGHAD